MVSCIYSELAWKGASWNVDIANRSKREKHISNKKERLWKESIKRKGVRKGINTEKEGIQMIMTIHSGFVIILRKIVSLLNRF